MDFFSDQQVNTFAYTASFGSGFTATVAIEDKTDRAIGAFWTAWSTQSASLVGRLADQELPNVVAALRVDQAWGAAQISAAVQDNEGDDLVVDLVGEAPDLGWAVQAGVQINLPVAVEGSYVWLQATYNEGANAYGFLGDTLDIDNGKEDFSIITGDLSKQWAVGGGINFQATENVALYGSAAFVSYEAADVTSFSPDSETIQAAAGVLWVPVNNLNLIAEAQYVTVDFTDSTHDDDR